jgi:hypothetical protein
MRKAGNVTRADVFIDETGRSKGCGCGANALRCRVPLGLIVLASSQNR